MTGRAERELLDGLGGQLYTEAVERGWLEADDPRFGPDGELAEARDRLVELGLLRWDDTAGRHLPVDPTATSDRIVVPMAQQGSALLRESAEWHSALGRLVQVWRQGAMGTGVFATDDCRATYEELRARGVEFLSAPEEQPYGVEAVFKDNSGNWFSLTQR